MLAASLTITDDAMQTFDPVGKLLPTDCASEMHHSHGMAAADALTGGHDWPAAASSQ